MSYALPQLTHKTQHLKDFLRGCLETTLGKLTLPPPPEPPPAFAATQPAQMTQQILAGCTPTIEMMNDLYLKGCNVMMCLYHNLHSNTIYKQFSNTQKAVLCGWCRAQSWAQVPQIWKQIEGTKTEEDLTRLLTTEWGHKFQGNINVLVYNIHFVKELLEAIHKVKFVDGPQATFLMVENGLSNMNLMPQSREEMARLDAEQCLQDSTAMTATFTEAKKWQKAPRLLPIQFGLLTNLLTVYALFLEMLFTERNAHLWGLNNLC